MKLVEYYFPRIYGHEDANDEIAKVRQIIYNLVDEYKRKHDLVVNASQYSSSSFQSKVSTCARKWLMAKDRLKGFDAYVSSTTDFESVRSEMNNYLGEPVLPISNDFN